MAALAQEFLSSILSSRVAPLALTAVEITMAYVIAESCIGTKDTACVDACPCDCIHPRKDEPGFSSAAQLYIDPVECIDCGACVPACPVSAIFHSEDLSEQWKKYEEINANFYAAQKI